MGEEHPLGLTVSPSGGKHRSLLYTMNRPWERGGRALSLRGLALHLGSGASRPLGPVPCLPVQTQA